MNLVTYDYLCTHLSGKKMTPVLTEIHSKTLAETNGFLKHEGEEFVYVLQGTLQLHTEFYEPLVLDTGASVYFDSTMGHTYVSVGEKPLKILSVMSSSPNLLFNTESDAQPVDAGAKAGVTPSKPQSRGRRIRAARSHEKH
ncbi:MAG: cupin domain-containing protein [Steroidobacteraceae bacterium]